jgi:hypothetical protein
MYTFYVQVQITLDDNDQEEIGVDWKLPKKISKEAKEYILYNMNETEENSGNYFEDGLYEILNCPVDNVTFVLE